MSRYIRSLPHMYEDSDRLVSTVIRPRVERLENWGLFSRGGEDIFTIFVNIWNIF